MRSSYAQHQYDEVFYRIVESLRPSVAVELGVLDGYSTLAIARALRDNQFWGGAGRLDAYDLFEQYPYNHGRQVEVQQQLEQVDLDAYVRVEQADAFSVHERYAPGSVGFLHVDLSNTGEIIHRIMAAWDARMVIGGLICFEGGSEERDQVDWMTRYGALPIKPAVESDPILNSRYVYGTYLRFPSLTVALKKRAA